jgi:hypothetical protein
MPTDQAAAREVRLIKAVAAWVRAQGSPCHIQGWPDREPASWPSGLTTEAVLAIGDEHRPASWAADVMGVPVPGAVAAGMAEARQKILPRAAVLAAAARRAVTISIRFAGGDAAKRNEYYEEVLRHAEEALQSGDDYWDESGADPETQVVLFSSEFFGDPAPPTGAMRVNLVPFTGTNADLLAEVQDVVTTPLAKKLDNQLKRAKDLGYATLLVLDQQGNESLPAGTTWLPSTGTVSAVLKNCVAAHPGVLDAAVLAQIDGAIMPIFGSLT